MVFEYVSFVVRRAAPADAPEFVEAAAAQQQQEAVAGSRVELRCEPRATYAEYGEKLRLHINCSHNARPLERGTTIRVSRTRTENEDMCSVRSTRCLRIGSSKLSRTALRLRCPALSRSLGRPVPTRPIPSSSYRKEYTLHNKSP